MIRSTLHSIAAAAFIALAAMPSIAEASQAAGLRFPQMAQPSAELRVRAGPGTMFLTLGWVSRSQYLNVRTCAGVWCQLTPMDGVPGGWVHRNYLIFRGEVRG